MPHEIRMPSLGQTTEELRIVTWHKQEGDLVRLGEPLLEVETDKATVEVEAFASGVLLKVLRGEDEVVEAGELLAYIGAPGEMLSEATTTRRPPVSTTFVSQNRQSTPTSPSNPDRILASPAARQLARDHAVDLAQVRGSGPGGRIEKQDVEAFLNSDDR